MTLLVLTGAFSIAGLALPPPAAQAGNAADVNQCNGIEPVGAGVMTCTVTVVNTIRSGTTSSTTTLTRTCAVAPCPGGTGTFTTSSTSLVLDIQQCNSSDNVGGEFITCNVTVTNNLSADTPGALPVTAATVNQCVGSGGGGTPGGTRICDPFPATTSGATVTQCNGSANGGGGTVDCAVGSASRATPAIPIRINQCNGTGNGGGSTVTCRTSMTTNVAAVASPTPTPTPTVSAAAPATPTPTATSTPPPTATSTPSSNSTPTSLSRTAPPQVSRVPSGGVQTGGGSTAGLNHLGLLALGGGLLLAAGVSALLRRQAAPGA